MTTHFIDIHDHSPEWLKHVLQIADELLERRRAGKRESILAGKTLAMLFEKPSLRTRVSFEQGMLELGGSAIVLNGSEVGLGQRESVADVTRVLTGMVQGIMARVFEHDKLRVMAAHADIPVINALSDVSHPCQALADIMTMQQTFGPDLSGRHLAFIGDGNNVARSLARLCARLDIRFTLAAPKGYRLPEDEIESIRAMGSSDIKIVDDPIQAVRDADAIYADTFVSMGQEEEKARRLKDFVGYQINEALLKNAPTQAIVLHCLPAYRGIEITDAAMDGPAQSCFFSGPQQTACPKRPARRFDGRPLSDGMKRVCFDLVFGHAAHAAA